MILIDTERPVLEQEEKVISFLFMLLHNFFGDGNLGSLGTNHILGNGSQVRFLKFCWIGFFKNEFLVLFLEACSFLFNFTRV